MTTIQVVLDAPLLQAADRAARRAKQNRSALIREALRAHLTRIDIQAKEARERAGYKRVPDSRQEAAEWEIESAWPRE